MRSSGRELLPPLLGFIAFVFLACQTRPSDNGIIARVGDTILDRETMRQRMAWEGMNPEQESEYVDRWVNRELLYHEAKRLGLDKEVELRWELELIEREYLIQKLLEKTFARKIQITDKEITFYYEKNKELFQTEEDEVRALHILTKTRPEANIALQEVQAGKPFEEVAFERSVGIFRAKKGDMGFFKKGDVIPEVARYAFRLSEGRVTPIFRSSHGYHILKVLKKRVKGDVKDLEDVWDEILQRMRVSKERSIYYDLLFQLQNKTKVDVFVPEDEQSQVDSLVVQEAKEDLKESER